MRVEMGAAVCERERETRLVRRSSRIAVRCEGAIGRSSPVQIAAISSATRGRGKSGREMYR